MGRVDLALGNYDRAVYHFAKCDSLYPTFTARYEQGKALYLAGQLGDAVEVLEDAMTDFDDSRLGNGIASVLSHYHLGRAYEDSGWKGKAIEQYTEFLAYWGNADHETKEIADARERLAKLKPTS
jgi:tetratricopeptide (TPR) repeat protein